MIKDVSETFSEEDDGFEGNVNAYIVPSKEDNLKNWFLQNFDYLDKIEIDDFINAIKNNSKDILIIKNLNIDEEYQGNGYGSQIIEQLMDEDFDTSILIADITESQKEGFKIEKFYNAVGFKSVIEQDKYPIMIFPERTADKVIKEISPEKPKKKRKFKL